MKSQARVVVIGGGIAGLSTLYHLVTSGWRDVVLVERDELTSGTTWHSAAQVTNFGPVQTMVGLKSHSIRLYHELAEDPDYPINYHHATGGIRLAGTPDHLDGYHHFVSMAKGMGVDFEVIDAAECQRRHPLIETHDVLGALWDPLDGDIDPAQLCQALARRARTGGAEIYRHNPVRGLHQKPNGEWTVHTDDGDIDCEIVVNAAGYRVNEVAAMMGVTHPVVSMEHQYFLTEPIAELESSDRRVPLIRCPSDDFYSRQEKRGLLVGIYEQGCKPWGLQGIDPAFTNALCPNDLDRCLDNMERVFARLPCLTETGIHTVINGPITYSADGLPLVGRVPGKRNAFCIVGLRAGLGEGGGHGKILAELITEGESEWDAWCLDPRRFGDYATAEYTALKAIEDYQNEFRFHMPHEHRPAGRPAKTTMIYPLLKASGAAFGVVNGWERATFFQPDKDFVEDHSFRFTNWHARVGDEVRAVQHAVGLMEVSGFNRYRIRGAGAPAWLDSLTCSRLPSAPGKLGLNYFLNHNGHLLAEATVAAMPNGEYWYGSAAAAELHDWDMLHDHLPANDVKIESLTQRYTTLVLAGPRSRNLLEQVAPRVDWSRDAMPWLCVREAAIGKAPVTVMRVSYSGELAFELHISNEHLRAVYQLLRDAGEDFDLVQFGQYAAESMRIEKGYLHWKADIISEIDPFEAGLQRFVRMDKPDFIGKRALATRAQSPRRYLVTLALDNHDGPAHSGESIMHEGRVIGSVTSAAWGYRVAKNLALALVQPRYANIGERVSVLTLGDVHDATVLERCQYDPDNARVRS